MMELKDVSTDNEIADFAYHAGLNGEYSEDAPACIDQLHDEAWEIWAEAYAEGVSDDAWNRAVEIPYYHDNEF